MAIPLHALVLLLVSIGLGAGGQLMFKGAASAMPPFAELGLWRLLAAMFTTPLILSGFTCFFISAVLWIIALRSVPLSIAYPMVAMSYIIIFTGSYFFFSEPITWKHLLGALLIVSGVALIAWRG
ncbi:EamA family transporter [bacterium]|nr:EamA family transporter [bacterium]